jgi:hypothetical protein
MLCSLLGCGEVIAQDTLRHYKTIPVKQGVALSSDNYGNIYVADKQGSIYSYDSLGNHLLTYSPPEVAEVTLLDARSTVRIFAFYRELQGFALLNRFLTPIELYRFQLPDGGFVRMAAQAADNTFWIYDDVALSLKKFDKKFGRTLLQTDLSLLLPNASLDITYMAEHQNMLFLLAEGYGILQFDNMGNFIRRLPAASSCFALNEDAVFYFENGYIVKQALYANLQTRLVTEKPLQHPIALAVTVTGIVTLEENLLKFWRQ